MSNSTLQIQCRGIVQGVGFRPFVYGLAEELGLTGGVKNVTSHVEIEIQGAQAPLNQFQIMLKEKLPRGAKLSEVKVRSVERENFQRFQIHKSEVNKNVSSVILPDSGTCEDCINEFKDPSNRRFAYPFITCTACGPRYSLSKTMPFDRENTTLSSFSMCDECRTEYEDPYNRRFHAQTISCKSCGPQLSASIDEIAERILAGNIIALKGTSGFHLMARADDDWVVNELRTRKHRPSKPFALMAPLEWVEKNFELSEHERNWLCDESAPIVLLKNKGVQLAPSIAPGFHELGVMLPSTPLHCLLMEKFNGPIVATSGNISEEPICVNNELAQSLPADYVFTHNLELVRGLDDSVLKMAGDRTILIRRSKGLVPEPLPQLDSKNVLALGGQLKNTVALSSDRGLFVSLPHGDLENYTSHQTFELDVKQLPEYFNVPIEKVVHDAHPDYASTQRAESFNVKKFQVQHHVAHVLGCAVENNVQTPFLGVAWDGAGWGVDGTVWGGEFFRVNTYSEVHRVANFKPFRLLGGDQAAKEPRRVALSLLLESLQEETWGLPWTKKHFTSDEIEFFKSYSGGAVTSSVGRLFDGVAAILEICLYNSFEGEAAMKLEGYFDDAEPFKPMGLDWRPWIVEIAKGGDRRVLASRFLQSLIQSIREVARECQLNRIVLSGGVFQNRELVKRLPDCYIHQNLPPNDSGLCLGQIVAEQYQTELTCV